MLDFDRTSFKNLQQRLRELEQNAAQHTKTKQDLRDSEERFRAVFDRAGIGMAVVSLEGRIEDANGALEKMLGYTRKELLGRSFVDITHPEDVEADWELARELIAGRRDDYHLEKRYVRKDGRVLWGRLTGSLARSDCGEPRFAIGMLEDITPSKRSEEALRGSEEKFRAIFDGSRDAVFITDRHARFICVNAAACALTGYTRNELLAMSIPDLHAPEDRDAYDRFFDRIMAGEAAVSTADILRKDGSKVPAEFNNTRIALLGDVYMHTTARDITERRRTEAALRGSEDRHRSILQTAMDGFWLMDEHGRLLEVNEAYGRMSGYNEEELLDLHVFDLRAPDVPGDLRAHLQEVMAAGEARFESRHRRKDGTLFDVEVSVQYRREDKGGRFVCFFRDITERKKAEQEREKWERRIRQAQKMEAIGNLAGGVAHDFNNLLFPIIGLAEMLLEDLPAGKPESESVEEILKAAQRGSDLVKQILAFSRRTESQRTAVRVQQVLEEVLRLSRSSIPSHIEIRRDLKDCGPVMADPTGIYQLAMNLITNAYQAMETAGGIITVGLRETGPASGDSVDTPRASWVELTVADTGSGIDPEVADKIFEPYVTTKEPGKGTGLGLAVVYGIVQDQGGDIRVTSEPDRGTTFRVRLPLVAPSPDEVAVKSAEEEETGRERILLVDDEESIARIAKVMLERLGYRVTARTGSIEALMTFRADPDAFDLVITDIAMPHMTGDRLAEEILSVRPDLPVILCTGFAERAGRNPTPGIRGTIIKPMTRAELAGTVRRVLDQGRRRLSD